MGDRLTSWLQLVTQVLNINLIETDDTFVWRLNKNQGRAQYVAILDNKFYICRYFSSICRKIKNKHPNSINGLKKNKVAHKFSFPNSPPNGPRPTSLTRPFLPLPWSPAPPAHPTHPPPKPHPRLGSHIQTSSSAHRQERSETRHPFLSSDPSQRDTLMAKLFALDEQLDVLNEDGSMK